MPDIVVAVTAQVPYGKASRAVEVFERALDWADTEGPRLLEVRWQPTVSKERFTETARVDLRFAEGLPGARERVERAIVHVASEPADRTRYQYAIEEG